MRPLMKLPLILGTVQTNSQVMGRHSKERLLKTFGSQVKVGANWLLLGRPSCVAASIRLRPPLQAKTAEYLPTLASTIVSIHTQHKA